MSIFAMRTKYNFGVILLTSILTFVFIFPLPEENFEKSTKENLK